MNNLQNKKYWVWFSLVQKLGSRRKQKLLKKYKTPEKIYQLTKGELEKIDGIGEHIAENILDSNVRKDVDLHIKYMEKNHIEIVSINEKEYPENLKQIYDPPISLYIRGNKEILNQKNMAIVGCRNCSEYGKKATKYFAYQLAKDKFNIVSGLARGVDSYAHLATLCAKGKTIAVLGNGLDQIYPKENISLANEILKNGGAIISEYPLGTKPEKMNFPARNRIISGMSNGVIVVEAKEKSGSLITADFALEQGREVYAVPGNINSVNSVGTNFLIKQGAKIVTHYSDIDT